MSEQLGQGLSLENNQKAQDLYAAHMRFGASLTDALGVMRRADEARSLVAQARASGTIDDVPHVTQVFANGEFTQRGMLRRAQLHFDANLWQGHQLKQDHLGEFIQQARFEADEADVVIN